MFKSKSSPQKKIAKIQIHCTKKVQIQSKSTGFDKSQGFFYWYYAEFWQISTDIEQNTDIAYRQEWLPIPIYRFCRNGLYRPIWIPICQPWPCQWGSHPDYNASNWLSSYSMIIIHCTSINGWGVPTQPWPTCRVWGRSGLKRPSSRRTNGR